ncbi:substrate-binding domain-containing protein [Paenibacillus chondroitinus]|uniref:Substrate-binding domain-containing protein n=1 Tax=Paenibacillus chondroitinus TaxID=59842 RepID=A0ABU6DAV1_9BACL|nr:MULTISPECIES: substrate-binding domain-containing protein [Paenibacillus]MCY9656773.1 substrate-binding domain-containing protein [Paenibacillus anseongense]MEB4794422.1 substrate-binding domain-containing protein [Paenibacillus chondroitinus]
MVLKKPVFLAVLLVIVIGFLVVYSVEMLRITNQRKFEIAVVLKTNSIRSDYWQMVSSGVKAAAKELAVNIEITGPLSETDTAGQIRNLDEALVKKPDAIILAATDYERLTPTVDKIRAAGIKVILIDSPIQTHVEASLIATDNIEAGRKAGKILAGGQNGSLYRVMTLSSRKGSIVEKDREDGFKDAIADFPGVEYAGNYAFDGTEDGAYDSVKNLLAQYPDIRGIAGLSETAALGAARAVKEKQRVNQINIVGFDSSIYQIKLLEEGSLQATIVQKPFNMGYLSLETTVQALNGIKVNPKVNIDAVVITKENMYTQENQELLFPLVEK